jgi:hypothetical protein
MVVHDEVTTRVDHVVGADILTTSAGFVGRCHPHDTAQSAPGVWVEACV